MDLREKLDAARQRLALDLDIYRGLVALRDIKTLDKTTSGEVEKALPFADRNLRVSIHDLVQAAEAMGIRP